MISHLVLVYLLMTLSMLLFEMVVYQKKCQIFKITNFEFLPIFNYAVQDN